MGKDGQRYYHRLTGDDRTWLRANEMAKQLGLIWD
jgi:hypothetical protein